nr:hypothetical protein [uncultured Rhodoferax sp.]
MSFSALAQVQSVRETNLRQVLNGPCAANTYGSFLQSAVLNDGREKLVRPKVSADPGAMRGPNGEVVTRVLEVKSAEVLQVWLDAHSAELDDAETAELAQLCGGQNMALKSAMRKVAMKRALETATMFARQGPALFANPKAENDYQKRQPPPNFSVEEEQALASLRGSDLAQSAIRKINTLVVPRIKKSFDVLDMERGRDEPVAKDVK